LCWFIAIKLTNINPIILFHRCFSDISTSDGNLLIIIQGQHIIVRIQHVIVILKLHLLTADKNPMSISSFFFFPSAFLTSLLLGLALATGDLLFCLQGIGFSKLCTDMESSDKGESSDSMARRFACFALDSLSCWRLI
jgi:hypothetical protein